MRKLIYPFFLLLFYLGSIGFAQPNAEGDTLFQASTLGALLQGVFDGDLPFSSVKAQGDFGLGTFDKLDGELVAFDGEYYQIKADGAAYRVDDAMTTPFVAVTFFEADDTLTIDAPLSCTELGAVVAARFPSPNLYYALRVDGTFSYLQTRSVEPQTAPYPTLAEALENQVVFEFEDVQATLAGFWLPPYMAGLNVAGYHYHALTADKKAGGHVLDCQLNDGTVQIDYTDALQLELPATQGFLEGDLD